MDIDDFTINVAPELPQFGDNCNYARMINSVRAFFALPPDPLPAHIIERHARRSHFCLRLLEHLRQPDGTFDLCGLNLGQIARAIGTQYKHIFRALKDLVRIGLFEMPRAFLGNRCGHIPAQPRAFEPPKAHRRHPPILERLIVRILDYYDDPKHVLPGLNFARPFKNGKSRQRRSCRREACIALLSALLWHTDLVTLKVMRVNDDGSHPRGIPMASKNVTLEDGRVVRIVGLAELAGLSLSRAEEAMHDLKAAGIVRVHEIWEEIAPGIYRGYSAVRTISQELFNVFNMGAWLKRERDDAAARQRKKRRKQEARNEPNGAASVKMLMGAQPKRKKKGHNAALTDQQLAAQNAAAKNRTQIFNFLSGLFPDRLEDIMGMMRQHPDASADELAAILSGTDPP